MRLTRWTPMGDYAVARVCATEEELRRELQWALNKLGRIEDREAEKGAPGCPDDEDPDETPSPNPLRPGREDGAQEEPPFNADAHDRWDK